MHIESRHERAALVFAQRLLTDTDEAGEVGLTNGSRPPQSLEWRRASLCHEAEYYAYRRHAVKRKLTHNKEKRQLLATEAFTPSDGPGYNVAMRGSFTIGDVIRKARKARGWDQERLGEEALKFKISGDEQKVNKATISKIEGANPYTSELGIVWRVLAALDLSFADVERKTGTPFLDLPEKKRARAN